MNRLGKKILAILFSPAIALMGKLQYWQKFLFISVFFMLPIGTITYFFVGEINTSIDRAHSEQLGLNFVNSLRHLLQSVQQHRGMASAYLNGNENFKKPLAEKRDEIERDFAAVKFVTVEMESLLEAGAHLHDGDVHLADLKNEWFALERALNAGKLTPLASFQAHTNFSEHIIDFIAHIGDFSGLILDPELDTYYLMDATVNRIPAVSELMGQARAFGLTLKFGKPITQGDRQVFLSLSSTIGFNVRALNRGMENVFEETPALRGKLAKPFEERIQEIDSFLKVIDKNILQADINTLNAEEYYTVATRAIDSVFELYDYVSPVFHDRLQDRIDAFTSKRDSVLWFTVSMLAFVAYLFVGFYLGLRGVIKILNQTTERMITSGSVTSITLDTKDELGEIANSFNKITRALTASNAALGDSVVHLRKSEQDLTKNIEEVNSMNRLMVDRELKMIELKEENKALKAQLAGQAAPI